MKKIVGVTIACLLVTSLAAAAHDGDLDTSYVANGSGYPHHAGGGLAPIYVPAMDNDGSSRALAFLRKGNGDALLVGSTYDSASKAYGTGLVGIDPYGDRTVQTQCSSPYNSCYVSGGAAVFAALPSGDSDYVLAVLSSGPTDGVHWSAIHNPNNVAESSASPGDFGNPGTNFVATAAAFDTSGRLYVAGYLKSLPGDQDFFIVRLVNPATGFNVDYSFGTQGIAVAFFDRGGNHDDQANALAIGPDGKIVVVGTISTGSFNQEVGVVRLTTDGVVDTSFGPDHNGKVHLDFFNGLYASKRSFGYAVALRDDGSMLIGGAAYHDTEGSTAAEQYAAIARLDEDGLISPTGEFGHASSGTDNAFVAGDGATVLFHYFPDDSLEVDSDVRAIVVQRNGRILLTGATERGSVTFFGISRLERNGDPDTTFSNFGSGGKHDSTRTYSFATGQDASTYDIAEGATNNQDIAYGLVDTPGGIYVYGSSTLLHQNELDFGYIRLVNHDAIFADGFGVLPPGG